MLYFYFLRYFKQPIEEDLQAQQIFVTNPMSLNLEVYYWIFF